MGERSSACDGRLLLWRIHTELGVGGACTFTPGDGWWLIVLAMFWVAACRGCAMLGFLRVLSSKEWLPVGMGRVFHAAWRACAQF